MWCLKYRLGVLTGGASMPLPYNVVTYLGNGFLKGIFCRQLKSSYKGKVISHQISNMPIPLIALGNRIKRDCIMFHNFKIS